MELKVIRVKKEDQSVVNFIVTNLTGDSSDRPSENHLDKLLTDDRTYLLAVILDKEVIGYALAYCFPSLYESKNLAYLYDIEVVAARRRKGAGRLLIEALLNYLKADNVSELWLGTAVDNVEGQALFSATGAARTGETFNDFTYDLSE